MGQGLGRNSPVVLSLGKENYEALIDRHGQWVRWRVSTKCPCAKKGSPDIHCDKCGGRGYIYSYQKEKTVSQTVMITDNAEIIEVDSEYNDCRLVKVYDQKGNVYSNAVKKGHFVILNGNIYPVKGEYITVVMTEETLRNIKYASTEKIGSGYYRVSGIRSSKSNIDGLYHTVPGDIEAIGKITDAAGIEYKTKELRQDTFYIEPSVNAETGEKIPITEPVNVENVSYIPPSIFVLLAQNLSKGDEQTVQELKGDAMLTFPYNCDVSNDDIVTVLSGTYTMKEVVKRVNDSDFDTIGAYFVDSVIACVGTERDYTEGVDFLLCGSNRIKWLCDDCPEEGENYSITYRVFPTYRVVQDIPQIRTSENQRMPKKAVVKLLYTYSEKAEINMQ